jgi:hypothetical protein
MIVKAMIDEGTYSLTWDLNHGGSFIFSTYVRG